MVEKILEARTEKVYHENIMEPFLAKVINIRYARYVGVSKRSWE